MNSAAHWIYKHQTGFSFHAYTLRNSSKRFFLWIAFGIYVSLSGPWPDDDVSACVHASTVCRKRNPIYIYFVTLFSVGWCCVAFYIICQDENCEPSVRRRRWRKCVRVSLFTWCASSQNVNGWQMRAWHSPRNWYFALMECITFKIHCIALTHIHTAITTHNEVFFYAYFFSHVQNVNNRGILSPWPNVWRECQHFTTFANANFNWDENINSSTDWSIVAMEISAWINRWNGKWIWFHLCWHQYRRKHVQIFQVAKVNSTN